LHPPCQRPDPSCTLGTNCSKITAHVDEAASATLDDPIRLRRVATTGTPRGATALLYDDVFTQLAPREGSQVGSSKPWTEWLGNP